MVALGGLLKKRGVRLVVASNFVAPVMAFASGPILARGLGVDDRGILAGLVAVLIVAPLVVGLGQQEASVRLYHRHFRSRWAAMRRLTVTSIGVGLLGGVAVAVYFIWTAGQPTWVYALVGGSYVLVMAGLMPSRGWLVYHERFAAITTEKIVQAGLRLGGLVVLLIFDSMSVESAFIVHSLSTIAGSAVLVLYLWRDRLGHDRSQAPTAALGRLTGDSLRLGASVWLGVAGAALILRLDQILMPYLSNVYELGLYVVSATLAEAALLVSNALRVVALPHFLKEGSDPQVGRATVVVLLLAACAAAIAWVVGPSLIELLFGADFRPGAGALTVLAPAVVLAMWLDVLGAANIAAGRAFYHGIGIVAGVAVAGGSLPFLLPPYGAVGAAVSTLAAYSAAFVCASLTSRSRRGDKRVEVGSV